MTDLHDQLREYDLDLAAGQLYEGIITNSPADPSEGVLVRLPDQDKQFGPMPWSERASVPLPLRGDRALFTKSDQETYWCIGWWPYGS